MLSLFKYCSANLDLFEIRDELSLAASNETCIGNKHFLITYTMLQAFTLTYQKNLIGKDVISEKETGVKNYR